MARELKLGNIIEVGGNLTPVVGRKIEMTAEEIAQHQREQRYFSNLDEFAELLQAREKAEKRLKDKPGLKAVEQELASINERIKALGGR